MRVPLYRQLESSDCGPACIRMVSAYYGKAYRMKTLKALCHLTRIGISIRDVVGCCEAIGFEAACVNVGRTEVRRMPLPAILYLRHGHFVVLEKVRAGRSGTLYTLLDPAYGRVCLPEEKLAEKWLVAGKGVAVVMSPKPDFRKINPEREGEERRGGMAGVVTGMMRKYRRNFFWIFLLTFVVLGTSWAMPLLLGRTIDDGIMQKDIHVVWVLLLGQFAFFIGYMVSDNITDLVTAKTSIRINVDFISRYLKKVIRLPMAFFDSTFRSDLIQRLGDQERLNSFITDNIMGMLFVVLNILVFSVMLLVLNVKIFLLFLLFSVVSVIYNLFFLRKRKYLDYSLFTAESERRNVIYEMVMGMPEIKINNAQQARIAEWKRKETRINELRLESIYLNYYMSNGSNFIDRLKDIVLTGLCAFYVIQDHITLGGMMMISYVLGQLSGPVGELIKFSRLVQDSSLSNRRLADIYEKPDENHERTVSLDGRRFTQGIRFEGVSFRYEGSHSRYVLRHIDLEVPLGKTTAIVGASGSGKTTLVKLLLGFYYPTEGSVHIDGEDIRNVNLDSWRARCGVVMQDGFIFSGSVADNIALSDENPTLERLKHAARLARIAERIEALPMGYHTQLGETGLELSGGEKQRIHIARAVYRDPDFLFFDEATSSLDANNEREIIDNLEQFCRDKTVVIVAHRLSTVKNADHIIVLDGGEIVEQGTHEELTAKRGRYYQLVRNQLELGT